MASLREPDSDVPQRVMPLTPHPRLSKALEQQLFTQLLVALNSNSSRSSSAGVAVPSAPRSPAPAPAPVSMCAKMKARSFWKQPELHTALPYGIPAVACSCPCSCMAPARSSSNTLSTNRS